MNEFENRYAGTRRTALVATLAILAMGALSACGDDPFAVRWSADPDTVLLYSLGRPELNLVAGYDFFNRRAVRVESPDATGSWDVAVDTRDGRIVLVTPQVLGVDSKAGIATMEGLTFDEVTEAPADTTAYVTDVAVPMTEGAVYVVRTNRRPGAFGSRCAFYAKMQALNVDVTAQTLTFVFDGARACNSRDLVPTEG
ncbi:MAG: hypothetical protein OEZ65_03480 [Gemmatimonadota bacterium]|nr:hypothetical protein [Gemmatimonadota bacterium]MDH5758624.1 hypothetical protein [Gemmatimonadota bacterium]